MAGDLLDEFIAEARRNAPGVPDDVWSGVEAALRAAHGGRKNDYIRRRTAQNTKAGLIQRLEQAAQEQEAATGAQLAQRLGVGVRTVERYHPLIKGE